MNGQFFPAADERQAETACFLSRPVRLAATNGISLAGAAFKR
jgi:hypothetical protein